VICLPNKFQDRASRCPSNSKNKSIEVKYECLNLPPQGLECCLTLGDTSQLFLACILIPWRSVRYDIMHCPSHRRFRIYLDASFEYFLWMQESYLYYFCHSLLPILSRPTCLKWLLKLPLLYFFSVEVRYRKDDPFASKLSPSFTSLSTWLRQWRPILFFHLSSNWSILNKTVVGDRASRRHCICLRS